MSIFLYTGSRKRDFSIGRDHKVHLANLPFQKTRQPRHKEIELLKVIVLCIHRCTYNAISLNDRRESIKMNIFTTKPPTHSGTNSLDGVSSMLSVASEANSKFRNISLSMLHISLPD